MSCTVKTNTISDLKDKKIIKAGSREILDLAKFEEINDRLTKHAIEKYGLKVNGKKLFDTSTKEVMNGKKGKRSILRAEPNNQMFDLLDDLVEEYKKNNSKKNTRYQKNQNIEDLLDENKRDILYTVPLESEVKNDVNSNNEILFNNENKKFTALEVLDNIKANYVGLNEKTLELIDKILPLLDKTKANISFVKSESLEKDSLMEYDSDSNVIKISKDVLDNLSAEEAIETFLHEVVHSVTVKAFVKPETINEEVFKDFILNMFQKYETLSEGDSYGFTNPEEFIAEIMTNSEFQQEIKELSKGKLWNQFVDFIRSLIGLKKINDYDAIIDNIASIAKESTFEGNQGEIAGTLYKKKNTKKDNDFYELDTLEKRQNNIVRGIKDNLDYNIKVYDLIIKKAKDPSVVEKYNDQLKDLLEEIESYTGAKEWQGIISYINQLDKNLKSLKKKLNNEDFSDKKEIINILEKYEKYLAANSTTEDLSKFLASAAKEKDLPISKEELSELRDTLGVAISNYKRLEEDMFAWTKEGLLELLNERRYATKVLKQWRTKLGKEFKELGLRGDKNSWINDQMTGVRSDEIDKDVYDFINKLIENPQFDITQSTALFNSVINTNSELIRVFQNRFGTVRENIIERNREVDFELKPLFEKLIKEKGNVKPSELYKNLIEETGDGQYLLKGKYKYEFRETYNKLKVSHDEAINNAKNKYGENTDEYYNVLKSTEFYKWLDANTRVVKSQEGKKRKIPISKWETDFSKLSKVEKEVLSKFKDIMHSTNKDTYGMNSLISKPFFGTRYYKLPAINNTTLERTLEGNATGIIKDAWKDMTEVRLDDVGYEEKLVDAGGRPINKVKIQFRGNLEKRYQSLDLFTLMRLEARNGINFSEKDKAEGELSTIVSLAKNTDFYITNANKSPILGAFMKRNKKVTHKGENTNTYKKLQNLMESNIYDILHKNVGNIGKVDFNKVIGTANAWTGLIGMSLNEVSATVNVLNGSAQMFLETIAGNYITRKSLAKAEKVYFNDLKNNMKDISSPIKESFTNQVTDMFDTWGSISTSVKQGFIKNGLLKSNVNLQSLQFMQQSGEHWLQSTLTMAVLDNIKVFDKDNSYIDKKGNKVKTEKEAASLLDMLEKNDKGKLEINDKVQYTTHSQGVEFNKGGKELVMQLVKKKISDTMGMYDSNLQPEAMRHWYGKVFGMYRKYLIPLGLARFRGTMYVNRKQEDLESHELFFNEALQEFETGTYTETARYLITSVLPAIKKMQYKLLSEDWKNLSDTQKGQIKKAITELSISFILLPALMALLEAMKGDDDDNELIYFLLLSTRRLQSELTSYNDVNEQWRLIQSPIPSMRVLEGASNLLYRVVNPFSWDDKYESGPNTDMFKIQRNVEQLIPILNNRNSTYKQKLQYVENMAN